jgi:uncharacterized membrane protein YcgQ (UPF0703/DUF1980 family)
LQGFDESALQIRRNTLLTFPVYPEPSAYVGQKAKVLGFVVHPPDLSEQYFIITRFVIGHCALDAYPVGLLVQLP